MKIMIIGQAGAGKSTLARKLGETLHLPVLHLDQLCFLPNWKIREHEQVTEKLASFLNRETDWVIEGNYRAFLFQRRLEEADLLLYLTASRWRSLYRICKRWLTYHGQVRPDMAAGCPERIDWDFFCFVLYKGRKKERLDYFETLCRTHAHKSHTLRTPKDIKDFLKEILKDSDATITNKT